jgi:hypothetical protein
MQSGYTLSRLRVIYISKMREHLASSIRELSRTLEWIDDKHIHGAIKPMPYRLQRRAWRVWYNKAPHAIGWSKRHYVFHDWRYGFDFFNVTNVKYVSHVPLETASSQTHHQFSTWEYVYRHLLHLFVLLALSGEQRVSIAH